MFSHIVVGSNDIDRSKRFYDGLFGKEAKRDDKGRLSYGRKGSVFMVTSPIDGEAAAHGNGATIGFMFDSPEEVDAWHAAGVAAGGTPIEDPPGYPRECVRQALPRLSARSRRQQALRPSPAAERMSLEIVSARTRRTAGGSWWSSIPRPRPATDMTFSIFLPPQAERGGKLPVVWYLSGLTCTHANVTEKGEYRARLRRARPDLRRARHQPARRRRAR